jgi:hypothetical protein
MLGSEYNTGDVYLLWAHGAMFTTLRALQLPVDSPFIALQWRSSLIL